MSNGYDDPARALLPAAFASAADPGFLYTEYVDVSFDAAGADFNRLSVPWFGALHSPGTRVNFRTDAVRIELFVTYLNTFTTPGAGRFRLERDGTLLPGYFGSDVDVGNRVYELVTQADGAPHDYSLIMPYASDVKFRGLRLSGGSASLLGTPTSRPSFLYIAYGDSITHGFDASSAAEGYPFRVGLLRNWSVVNMGFTARTVTPADGTAVGVLGADCLSVAIGVNDYFDPTPTPMGTFEILYDDFLTNIRDEQPTVPLFAITPTWVKFEGVTNSLGLTVEDYRQVIRDVVFRRQGTDPNLYMVEGPLLVPGSLANFPGGIHPNDAGFAAYATSLDAVFTGIFGAPDGAAQSLAAPTDLREGSQRPRIVLNAGGRGAGESAPRLVPHGLPTPGGILELSIESSAEVPAVAWLAVELAGGRASVPATTLEPFTLPVDGRAFSFRVPEDLAPGDRLSLQCLQLDPSAVGGVSSSRALSIEVVP